MKYFIMLLALIPLTISMADAAIEKVDFDELVMQSDLILVGKVIDIQPTYQEGSFGSPKDQFFHDVRLSIEQTAYVDLSINEISFRIIKDRHMENIDADIIEDSQNFEVGERVVVFLAKDSDGYWGGNYYVVGMSQGKYLLVDDKAYGSHFDGISERDLMSKIMEKVVEREKEKPLKLDDFASKLWYDHDYIIDGTILDIRGYDKPERTYDIQINSFFKPSEGAGSKIITVYGSPNFYNIKGDRGIFFIKKDDARWTFGEYGAKVTENCPPYLMYHSPPLIDPPLVRGQPPIDFSLLIDCYPYYYKKYLPQYIKARGATEFPSPRSQAVDGVPPHEIVCNEDLQVVIRHNGDPACVKQQSVQKLIERGWAKDDKQLCETFSGKWNNEFATCFDFSDDYDCENLGGKLVGRAYTGELPDYSKESDSFACEFKK